MMPKKVNNLRSLVKQIDPDRDKKEEVYYFGDGRRIFKEPKSNPYTR